MNKQKNGQMKKQMLTFLVILTMMLSSVSVVFAAAPSDVVGGEFEEAVTALVEQGVISGYADGTFHPQGTISRAEACVIVVKSFGVTDQELSNAAASKFSDLSGYAWAQKYINYAVSKGVVKGYPDGTFRPAGKVTNYEMMAILVQAQGYFASEIDGTWPTNFADKADELGVLYEVTLEGKESATRGNVAKMVFNITGGIYTMSTVRAGYELSEELDAIVAAINADESTYTLESMEAFWKALDAVQMMNVDTEENFVAYIAEANAAIDLLVLNEK